MKRVFVAAASLAFLPSCAAIIEGSSETITVNTTPAAASCAFQREQDEKVAEIAHIAQTPGQSTVKKTRKDITIRCQKPGYQDASFVNKSGIEPWFFGNILLGGLIGMGVDWGTGAYNAYEDEVNIGMVPLPGTTANGMEMPAAAPALQGLAAPTAAYEDGQPAMPPAATQSLAAPAEPTQPFTILPQATPAYVAPAQSDEDRPTPPALAPITIPSGNAAENTSGWGRR